MDNDGLDNKGDGVVGEWLVEGQHGDGGGRDGGVVS